MAPQFFYIGGGAKPVMVSPPTLTYSDPEGKPGGTLEVIDNGVWLNEPTSFEYIWRRQPTLNNPGILWFNDPGNTPVVNNAQQLGSPPEVLCEVKATNEFGSESAYTNAKVIHSGANLWNEVPMKFKNGQLYESGDPFEVFYRGKQLGRANDAPLAGYLTSARSEFSATGEYIIGQFFTNNIFNNNDSWHIIGEAPANFDGNTKPVSTMSEQYRRFFGGVNPVIYPVIGGSANVGDILQISDFGQYNSKTGSGNNVVNHTGSIETTPVDLTGVRWFVNGVLRVSYNSYQAGVSDRFEVKQWDRGAYLYAELILNNTGGSFPASQNIATIERTTPL